MFGETAQNAAPSPIEERAFEQRTRGLHTFRFATQLWYGLSMNVMKQRRIEGPVTVADADEAVKVVPVTIATMEQPGARDWVQKAQADGYGIVVMPSTTDEIHSTLVKTKRAAVAAKLTNENDVNFVLNEPKGDWDDVAKIGSVVIASAFALVGVVGAMLAMETLT